jgi:hypothetical protein
MKSRQQENQRRSSKESDMVDERRGRNRRTVR